MSNKAMFTACAAQCVWCAEQWPLIQRGDAHVHVGPFTKDPQLFWQRCKAEPIRIGFNYFDYEGGKQVKLTARSPEVIVRILTDYYERCHKESKGLGMQISSPKNRRFWRGPVQATIEVAGWPEWKRGGSDAAKTSPERLKKCRDELRFFDEIDYWTRQPCTGNQQYRPIWNKQHTNLVTPSCNGGFGCTTCWERYERQYDKNAENWID